LPVIVPGVENNPWLFVLHTINRFQDAYLISSGAASVCRSLVNNGTASQVDETRGARLLAEDRLDEPSDSRKLP